MSIVSCFYIGASGLTANSLEMAVVGDNIANANTVGFKGSRAAFEDVLVQSLVGGAGELGGGARVQAVQKLLAQGSIATTGIATDLALEGEGFFVVRAANGENLYTRAGQMSIDADGFLVNLEGLRVQGFPAIGTNTTGGLGDLNITGISAPPQATANITLRGNLSADPNVPILPPFDPADPAGTANFSTTVQTFDTLGNPHEVNVHFKKTASGTWEWHAVTDGANVDGGTAGTPVEVGTGTLTFDGSGNLLDVVGNTISFDPVGSPGAQTITLNLGDPINLGGLGTSGMVQQSTTDSAMRFTGQDGYGAGEIAGIKIDDQGQIVGTFTNGQTQLIGQIAVAQFAAPDQLERAGSNLFRAGLDAGDANVGTAGTGGRGTIVGGALELSNVDLAGEFVRMMVAQRNFQASSKTIQTADQLLAELIQLKR